MKQETVQGRVEEWQEATIEALVCYSVPSHRTKNGVGGGAIPLQLRQSGLAYIVACTQHAMPA